MHRELPRCIKLPTQNKIALFAQEQFELGPTRPTACDPDSLSAPPAAASSSSASSSSLSPPWFSCHIFKSASNFVFFTLYSSSYFCLSLALNAFQRSPAILLTAATVEPAGKLL